MLCGTDGLDEATLPRTTDGRATGTVARTGVWKYSVTAPYLQEDLS